MRRQREPTSDNRALQQERRDQVSKAATNAIPPDGTAGLERRPLVGIARERETRSDGALPSQLVRRRFVLSRTIVEDAS